MRQFPDRVVLLGAGFSHCVTKGDSPLTCRLLDKLPASPFSSLRRCVERLGTGANIEHFLSRFDAICETPLPALRHRVFDSDDQPRVITSELLSYCVSRLSRVNVHFDHWSAQLLANNSKHATVITTNYDNIAERVLSNLSGLVHSDFGDCHHCRMKRLLRDDCPCSRAGSPQKAAWAGSLLKLHGSVAWRTCRNNRCRGFECLVADFHCRAFDSQTCPCCDGPCEAVLVLPRRAGKYTSFPRIEAMWNAAASAIEDARELVVFGFSFPENDAEIKELFMNAWRSKCSLKAICVIDLDPESIADRVRRLLPTGVAPEIFTYASPSDFSTPDWWAAVPNDVN